MFGYPQIKSISQQNVQVFIFSHKKCWRLENVGRRMFLQPTWNLSLETTYKYLQWFFSLSAVFCLAQNRGINHETLLKLTNTLPPPKINKFYLVGWMCKTQLQSLGAVSMSEPRPPPSVLLPPSWLSVLIPASLLETPLSFALPGG